MRRNPDELKRIPLDQTDGWEPKDDEDDLPPIVEDDLPPIVEGGDDDEEDDTY